MYLLHDLNGSIHHHGETCGDAIDQLRYAMNADPKKFKVVRCSPEMYAILESGEEQIWRVDSTGVAIPLGPDATADTFSFSFASSSWEIHDPE